MIWSDWNKADKTLLLALVVFFFSLCVHLQYPHSVVADGMLFCAEAALVGGIADWFAVTALFRRPLGFSWHTAILPRRRGAFIEAAVTMVQQEFFSKKKLFTLIHQADLLVLVQNWLAKEDNQEKLAAWLLAGWKSLDSELLATRVAAVVKDRLPALLTPEKSMEKLAAWLQQSGHAGELLRQLAIRLEAKAASPMVRQEIYRQLDAYKQEKTGTGMGAFFANLAQSMDLVNLDEATDLLQQQLQAMLKDLEVPGSKAQEETLSVLFEKLIILAKNESFKQGFSHGITKLLENDLLKNIFQDALTSVATQPEASQNLQVFLQVEIQHWLAELQQDDGLQQKINHFLYDLVARSVLQAQSMIGDIVRSVLGRMTDEQLNRLVYDKVEPDLLWIRMNGSIVGAGIGFCIFALQQLAAAFH